ncbi:hypothetical protein ACFQGX_13700 [Nonomuraea dietziae]|uniref:hypothetical protein n=1 Tax=Nonomuraea dietziae TaxID=65515 RepID=UPI00360813F0
MTPFHVPFVPPTRTIAAVASGAGSFSMLLASAASLIGGTLTTGSTAGGGTGQSLTEACAGAPTTEAVTKVAREASARAAGRLLFMSSILSRTPDLRIACAGELRPPS